MSVWNNESFSVKFKDTAKHAGKQAGVKHPFVKFGVKLTSTGKWILIQELKYLNIH